VTEAEFQKIFNEHKHAVYRYAWRMSGSAVVAEDITQDVFVSLLRQPNRFDQGRGSMRAFLLGIARNIALKRWRDETRWEELVDTEFSSRETSLDRIESREVGEIVGEAVRSLPLLQREVLILAEYEEMSIEEIAAAVESETGTVKSRLHRARENLRRILAPLRPMNVENRERSTDHGTVKR